jgi:hypothetical protein
MSRARRDDENLADLDELLGKITDDAHGDDETLRASTLPGVVLDSVASTSSILKSPTCLRLTGGEPTVRAGIVDIVRGIASTRGIRSLSMTTNGVLLPRLARALAEAHSSERNFAEVMKVYETALARKGRRSA